MTNLKYCHDEYEMYFEANYFMDIRKLSKPVCIMFRSQALADKLNDN